MVSFICGQLCSGKTLYSRSLAEISGGLYIEVGDIVRKLKQTQDRKILQDSKHLSDHIVQYINSQISENTEKDIIVSGVRQKEIIEQFPSATKLWIECPVSVRRERYMLRARGGDSQTFDDAEKGDILLGIYEVKSYIFNANSDQSNETNR